MKRWSLRALALSIPFLVVSAPAWGAPFRRGDSNGDNNVDLSDAIHTLVYLFSGGVVPTCLDASDSDDSGELDLTDGIFTLTYLFQGGRDIPAPGATACGDDPTADSLTCQSYPGCTGPDPEQVRRVGHLLNRAAFGPTFSEVNRVLSMGIDNWITEQLDPEAIDEASNAELAMRVEDLTEVVVRREDSPIVAAGALWRYQKGNVAPPADWRLTTFNDDAWPVGASGFGYGDDDDRTVLDDMLGNYNTVYIRHEFSADPAAIQNDLILSIDYDDGFVAYLNGFEIARRNATGNPPANTATASASREAGTFEAINVTTHKSRLVAGTNVLAVIGLNQSRTSSDFSLTPELLDSRVIAGGESVEIRGISELKALSHVYSIYSRRQLQTVMALFWENHFTTDYDKVAEYFDALANSDASDAMSTAQARREAARLEHHEFEFLREHALGNFGDLVRYSATSPTMLIYLDNVLNVRGSPNENYPREILELHCFGADAGYVQVDIEQLAKCFTGWGVCKVSPENLGDPHSPCGVQVADAAVVAAGTAGGDWKYLKGTAEPPAAWKDLGFVETGWSTGRAGFGYGDGDDTTVLTDMLNGYSTVYLRKTFALTAQQILALDNLILSLDVDDGFVAYLNGTEVARYYAPGGMGTPVPFDALATQTHEAGVPLEYSLNRYRNLLVAGNNVLAIQVLNGSLDSSDLSMNPSFFSREILPGSIENGDPNAMWNFHFFPNLHNTADAKTLFRSTPYQLVVPAGRTGTPGIRDAEDAIQRILDHPSTPIFICTKIMGRLLDDTAQNFRSPPAQYASLLNKCIQAWNSTTPKGNIGKVVETILRSPEFWSESARRVKVKDAFEYVASTVRVLDGETDGIAVVDDLSAMGMDLFTRDEPDGWAEGGVDWIDTSTLLNRMKLAQAFTEALPASSPGLNWDAVPFLDAQGLDTAEEIVDFFDDLLFQGTLTDADRTVVLDFLNTDDAYNPLPFSRSRPDFGDRVRRALGLMLSLPQWQFQ